MPSMLQLPPAAHDCDWANPINSASPLAEGLAALFDPRTRNAAMSERLRRGAVTSTSTRHVMSPDFGDAVLFERASGSKLRTESPIPGSLVTVAAWVQVDTFLDTANYVSGIAENTALTGVNYNWTLRFGNGTSAGRDKIQFYCENSGGSGGSAVSSVAVTAGEAALVAGTWDGATIRVYTNGVQSGSGFLSGVLRSPTSLSLQIGTDATARNFDGLIGPLMIWNRALPSSQVYRLYHPATRWELFQRPRPRRWFAVPAIAPAFQSAWASQLNTLIGGGNA